MCVPPDVVEDGGGGVGVLGSVLPLLAPFRRLRRWGGREGLLSGAPLLPCLSGRPWRRGESSEVGGDLLLLVLVVEVFVDGAALAGLGGRGSGACW